MKMRPAMPDTPIHTHGRILEILSPVLCRVVLPNGKVLLAHASKAVADADILVAVNDEVLLEFTPYDFDTARILGLAGSGLSGHSPGVADPAWRSHAGGPCCGPPQV